MPFGGQQRAPGSDSATLPYSRVSVTSVPSRRTFSVNEASSIMYNSRFKRSWHAHASRIRRNFIA